MAVLNSLKKIMILQLKWTLNKGSEETDPIFKPPKCPNLNICEKEAGVSSPISTVFTEWHLEFGCTDLHSNFGPFIYC